MLRFSACRGLLRTAVCHMHGRYLAVHASTAASVDENANAFWEFPYKELPKDLDMLLEKPRVPKALLRAKVERSFAYARLDWSKEFLKLQDYVLILLREKSQDRARVEQRTREELAASVLEEEGNLSELRNEHMNMQEELTEKNEELEKIEDKLKEVEDELWEVEWRMGGDLRKVGQQSRDVRLKLERTRDRLLSANGTILMWQGMLNMQGVLKWLEQRAFLRPVTKKRSQEDKWANLLDNSDHHELRAKLRKALGHVDSTDALSGDQGPISMKVAKSIVQISDKPSTAPQSEWVSYPHNSCNRDVIMAPNPLTLDECQIVADICEHFVVPFKRVSTPFPSKSEIQDMKKLEEDWEEDKDEDEDEW